MKKITVAILAVLVGVLLNFGLGTIESQSPISAEGISVFPTPTRTPTSPFSNLPTPTP